MNLPIRQLAIATALALTLPAAAQSCPGDILADGVINGADLGAMLSYWGPRTTAPFSVASDLNGDEVINGGDLGLLLSAWGPCVPSWATLIEAAPDPDVVTNPTLRAAIVATHLPWRVLDTATQMEMVLVPPGSFLMGCSPSVSIGCEAVELPVHAVSLTRPFYLGRFEVTQSQWAARMGSNPSAFQGASPEVPAEQVPMRPVEMVSWGTVQAFLAATGMRLPAESSLCAVSILRAADCMLGEVRVMMPSVAVGKILIQRDEETALPTLFYSKLPPDVAMRQVLLLDPMLATGGSAVKAIECLVEKGVRPENIIFVNIVCVREGIAAIHSKYPQVKIVTGAIDPILNSKSYIVPGLGDFGDRYFGTDGRD